MPDFIAAAPGTFAHYVDPNNIEPSFRLPVVAYMMSRGVAAPVTVSAPPEHFVCAGLEVADDAQVYSLFTGIGYEDASQLAEMEQESLHKTEPGDPLGDLDILFTDRGFKKQSFWRFNGDTEFMFVVDAGDYIPDDPRVDKITRADFQRNRTTVPIQPYAALFVQDQPREAAVDLI